MKKLNEVPEEADSSNKKQKIEERTVHTKLPVEIINNLWKIYNCKGVQLDKDWIVDVQEIKENYYRIKFRFEEGCGCARNEGCHSFAWAEEQGSLESGIFVAHVQRNMLEKEENRNWVFSPKELIEEFNEPYFTSLKDKVIGTTLESEYECVKLFPPTIPLPLSDCAKIVFNDRLYLDEPIKRRSSRKGISGKEALETLRDSVSLSHVLFFPLSSPHHTDTNLQLYFSFDVSKLSSKSLIWVLLTYSLPDTLTIPGT